ncbi:hypothetical protein TNCV_396571 [Trichonephila clavipes]|nr:hypothetical protein TNCV_396571 [Trichonephila clavipes]
MTGWPTREPTIVQCCMYKFVCSMMYWRVLEEYETCGEQLFEHSVAVTHKQPRRRIPTLLSYRGEETVEEITIE